MGYRLKKEAPEKEYYFPVDPTCQNMKKITPEKVLRSIEELKPVVDIPESLAEKARDPLKKMVELGNTSIPPQSVFDRFELILFLVWKHVSSKRGSRGFT